MICKNPGEGTPPLISNYMHMSAIHCKLFQIFYTMDLDNDDNSSVSSNDSFDTLDDVDDILDINLIQDIEELQHFPPPAERSAIW